MFLDLPAVSLQAVENLPYGVQVVSEGIVCPQLQMIGFRTCWFNEVVGASGNNQGPNAKSISICPRIRGRAADEVFREHSGAMFHVKQNGRVLTGGAS